MNNANNTMIIVSQAFYGNRVATEIRRENVDRFILGYIDDNLSVTEPIDRTIVNVPNTDGIVLVYNKYSEAERKEQKKRAFAESNYVIEPLAVIPEENIEIYSRCIACRINKNGELESLREGDYDKFVKYLAE